MKESYYEALIESSLTEAGLLSLFTKPGKGAVPINPMGSESKKTKRMLKKGNKSAFGIQLGRGTHRVRGLIRRHPIAAASAIGLGGLGTGLLATKK